MVFLTMLVASFAAFFVGQALLSGQHLDASLSDPGALRSVLGAALYVTVAGIIALALGALLRNTAAAITTFVAVFFVIPTADPAAARVGDRPLRAVPAIQPRRRTDRRRLRPGPLARAMDRVRPAVRIRRHPHRHRGLATAPHRRLTVTPTQTGHTRRNAVPPSINAVESAGVDMSVARRNAFAAVETAGARGGLMKAITQDNFGPPDSLQLVRHEQTRDRFGRRASRRFTPPRSTPTIGTWSAATRESPG